MKTLLKWSTEAVTWALGVAVVFLLPPLALYGLAVLAGEDVKWHHLCVATATGLVWGRFLTYLLDPLARD
jgi:hypothetical protein